MTKHANLFRSIVRATLEGVVLGLRDSMVLFLVAGLLMLIVTVLGVR